MPDVAIRSAGVVKWFGEGEAKAQALKGVSLEAYFGEMLYIVGPSGSGKTTLLNVLSGILRPDSGSISVEGTDIWSLGSDKLADFRLQKIGRFSPAKDRVRIPGLSSLSPVNHRRERCGSINSQANELERSGHRGYQVSGYRRLERPCRSSSHKAERRKTAAGCHRPGNCWTTGHPDYGRANCLVRWRYRPCHRWFCETEHPEW